MLRWKNKWQFFFICLSLDCPSGMWVSAFNIQMKPYLGMCHNILACKIIDYCNNSGILSRSSMHFQQDHSMTNMFSFQLLMRLSLHLFWTIPSSTLSLAMQLVQLMAHTSIAALLPLIVMQLAIAKVSWHRTALHVFHGTWSSYTWSVDGKAQLQMPHSTTIHASLIFLSLLASITWLMLDLVHAIPSLYLIGESVITWLNGGEQHSGMSLFQIIHKLAWLTYDRPADAKELFNLRHAQARNVVERIFGVVKKRWDILTRAPQFDMSIQVSENLSLIMIHWNFVGKNSTSSCSLAQLHCGVWSWGTWGIVTAWIYCWSKSWSTCWSWISLTIKTRESRERESWGIQRSNCTRNVDAIPRSNSGGQPGSGGCRSIWLIEYGYNMWIKKV